jgi:hypothetical protein
MIAGLRSPAAAHYPSPEGALPQKFAAFIPSISLSDLIVILFPSFERV